jgi:hypothetical protein
MADKRLGDYDLTFEQAIEESIRLQRREFEAQDKPNIESDVKWILKNGPKAYKVAIYRTIRDQNTGEPHHHTLTIETLRRNKLRNEWIIDEKNTITLDDDGEDEIGKLLKGMANAPQIIGQGEYIVIDLKNHDDNRLTQILDAISTSGRKVDLLAEVLSWADDDVRVAAGLIKLAAENPTRSKSLAAGLNYGRYRQALNDLKILVEADHLEGVYQKFLQENFWMFGSEYSELLPNRTLVKGNILDFPLRRTVDGYLDIIEIKRPQNGLSLFRKDRRGNLAETSELVEAIAQADDYLANIDAEQYQIKYHEELDVEKVRAKIIIGRDGDEPQTKQLRRVNARTNRIEIITYDQLIRIVERILEILGNEAALDEEFMSYDAGNEEFPPPPDNIGDIPF